MTSPPPGNYGGGYGPPGDAAVPAGAGAAPVCPRHPDRVSYVRCQRCERPVCPQCQRQAPVGVQCVDCVKAAAKGRPPARTVFGGRVVGERPTATYSLIGITAAAFVLQWVVGNRFTGRFTFFPPLALAEPWRFLTAGFLHAPSFLLHIAFNMFALWMIGPYLERLFGHARFVAVYLLSAVGGSVGYFVIVPSSSDGWTAAVVGASGAVFGLFGALLVTNRRLQRDSYPLLGVLVVNIVLGFVPGIAWQAHLGGFVTGAACAAVLALAADRRGPAVQTAGLVAVLLVMTALVLAKAALVPPELLY